MRIMAPEFWTSCKLFKGSGMSPGQIGGTVQKGSLQQPAPD